MYRKKKIYQKKFSHSKNITNRAVNSSSSPTCNKLGGGLFFPSPSPLDFSPTCYKCNSCNASKSVLDVQRAEREFESQCQALKKVRGATFVDKIKDLVNRGSEIFHPSHHLLMNAKSQLISNLGNIPGTYL